MKGRLTVLCFLSLLGVACPTSRPVVQQQHENPNQTVIYRASIQITSEEYSPEMAANIDRLPITHQIHDAIDRELDSIPGIVRTRIVEFNRGSLMVTFDIDTDGQQTEEEIRQLLIDMLTSGNLSVFTVSLEGFVFKKIRGQLQLQSSPVMQSEVIDSREPMVRQATSKGISEQEIRIISKQVGMDWESLGTQLDYTYKQVGALKINYPGRVGEAIFLMIKKWHDIVLFCNEDPHMLLAGAFSQCGNNQMAETVVGKDLVTEDNYRPVTEPNPSPEWAALGRPDIYIDFGFLQEGIPVDMTQQFFFKPCVHSYDPNDCDFAVLELRDNDVGGTMPEPFTYFADPKPNGLFHLIGHSGGKRKHFARVEGIIDWNRENNQKDLTEARAWSKALVKDNHGNGRDGYLGADNPHRVIFRCGFEQGASGSPGIVVKADGRAVVVTMLVHGFPDWIYDDKVDVMVKQQCTPQHRIEQGTNLRSIYDYMSQSGLFPAALAVRDAIFGNPDGTLLA